MFVENVVSLFAADEEAAAAASRFSTTIWQTATRFVLLLLRGHREDAVFATVSGAPPRSFRFDRFI